MQTFNLPDNYSIECKSEKTRYGFRHLASLLRNGTEVAKYKACYYNRTWESYTFESVIHGVLRKHFEAEPIFGAKELCQRCIEIADKGGLEADFAPFRSTAMIANLGNLFCENQSDKNKWKQRMIRAGLPELDFPDGFDKLPEDEKEKRLDQIIRMAKGASC